MLSQQRTRERPRALPHLRAPGRWRFGRGAGLALALALIAAPVLGQPPTGRLVADTVDAAVLAGNPLGDPARQPAWVYLPPGYDAEPDRRYPVLYLLHGVLDAPQVWIEPAYDGMTIQATLDSLIGAGAIDPMLVVVVNGRNALGGSYYLDSPGSGRWETYLVHDVVGHVDGRYRTLAEPARRAVAGHSMGGFGAIRLGMRHPDVFGVVYGMNPCCLCCMGGEVEPLDDPDLWRGLEATASVDELWRALAERGDFWPLAIAGAAAAFSPEPDRPPLFGELPYRAAGDSVVPTGALERWAEVQPLAEAADHVEALRGLRGLAFDSAFDDEFVHIPVGATAFSDRLVELHVPHVFEVYEGDHRNRMRPRMATVILPWIAERLRAGTEP